MKCIPNTHTYLTRFSFLWRYIFRFQKTFRDGNNLFELAGQSIDIELPTVSHYVYFKIFLSFFVLKVKSLV